MLLSSIVLQYFRSYTQKKLDFSEDVTIVIGPNTAGKTNLSEAIHLLATGKSFKGPTDATLIQFGQDIGRVKGLVIDSGLMIQDLGDGVAEVKGSRQGGLNEGREHLRDERLTGPQSEKTTLEVVLLDPTYNNGRFGRKYLVNDVPKSRANFLGFLPLVLFRPEELDIVIDGPSVRRDFLNDVLEQVDRDYAVSLSAYERALRQRNALLDKVKELGRGVGFAEQFAYWDNLLIEHGQLVTQKREEFINWINGKPKDVSDFRITYDHSKISRERLEQYAQAEVGAGVTLVGPHRDDFFIELLQNGQYHNVKVFGSRGQQRLVVLQLKLLQIAFMTEKLGMKPLLVLDDIFSELDSGHIQLVLEKVKGQQAIITTTHKEFIPEDKIEGYSVIELERK